MLPFAVIRNPGRVVPHRRKTSPTHYDDLRADGHKSCAYWIEMVEVRVGVKSHQGLVRGENQDRMTQFTSAFGEVFAVADGMGGHLGGATAAAAVVQGIRDYLAAAPARRPLSRALAEATRT